MSMVPMAHHVQVVNKEILTVTPFAENIKSFDYCRVIVEMLHQFAKEVDAVLECRRRCCCCCALWGLWLLLLWCIMGLVVNPGWFLMDFWFV